MGRAHADRLEECLRLKLRELDGSDELQEFFDEDREEPFFIKNLERVQGDERDAIILSVGYGKNEQGRLLYRFGPLNNQGGERRLNVAVTRAKQRMTLVSAFTHHDMEEGRSNADGVKLLRRYLQYAESGGADLGHGAMERPVLNPFEIDVRDALVKAGINVVPQYGCSGYWIDFAAAHPERPGQMVLAIECDGAAYHSSPTARDRDRLRQDHLERLGWTFHRIWSHDWFHHRDREIVRVGQAYEAAVRENNSPAGAARNRDHTAPAQEPAGAAPRRTLGRPPSRGDGSIGNYSHADLCAWVRYIESDTLLRSEGELLDEAIKEMGFTRRGKKIVAALEHAIQDVRHPHVAPARGQKEEEPEAAIYRRRPAQPRTAGADLIELLGREPGSSLLPAVGESHYQPALEEICGRRGNAWTTVSCEVTAALVPDPTNAYDAQAVKVMVNGRHVGHLSRADARAYADVIALAHELGAAATCRALISGRAEGSETRNLGIFLDLAPPAAALEALEHSAG